MSNAPETKDITLPKPATIGGKLVEKITLRKPYAGELRGVKLVELVQMDVDAIGQVIERISDPMITRADYIALDPRNLMEVSTGVVGFFVEDESPQT